MVKKWNTFGIDIGVIGLAFLAGLIFYGDIYKRNEKQFVFYQKYFHSAVNIYCLRDPDFRDYNSLSLIDDELNDRIDLSNISCAKLAKSSKVKQSYFNGWHDTHPILSTLIGYNWRLLGFKWEALWPIVGALASLTVLSFYVLLRCFGLPWYAALLLFPATVPFGTLTQNLYFVRDFSKVPFILLAFAFLGILFRPGISYGQRLLALSASTCTIAIGIGFRQDAVVLAPTILAAAAFTSSINCKVGRWRLGGEILAIFLSFISVSLITDLLKTGQVAQLQGYPHFLVQGFADDFWAAARNELHGLSFLGMYSDFLAWAAVDANSAEKIQYFAGMDPKYTSSGIDLIAKYSSLSAADIVIRVFSGLSVISHTNWLIGSTGIWLLLFLVLIAVGKWRLSFFLVFTIFSLAAAGSMQFSPRHSLHLILLDRVIWVIALGALLSSLWKGATSRLNFRVGLALYSGAAGLVLVVGIVVSAYFVQYASLKKIQASLEALPWSSSQEVHSTQFPRLSEAVLRFTIDRNNCSDGKLLAVLEIEGQKMSRPLDLSSSRSRWIYFTVFDPAIAKVSVEITPRECVTERAWGPIGDGAIPPLQFLDPETALEKHTIMRHLYNLVSSLL